MIRKITSHGAVAGTDCGNEIQACFDAGPGFVEVPIGVFKWPDRTLTLPRGVNLVGEGSQDKSDLTSMLVRTGTTPGTAIRVAGGSSGRIAHLQIRSTGHCIDTLDDTKYSRGFTLEDLYLTAAPGYFGADFHHANFETSFIDIWCGGGGHKGVGGIFVKNHSYIEQFCGQGLGDGIRIAPGGMCNKIVLGRTEVCHRALVLGVDENNKRSDAASVSVECHSYERNGFHVYGGARTVKMSCCSMQHNATAGFTYTGDENGGIYLDKITGSFNLEYTGLKTWGIGKPCAVFRQVFGKIRTNNPPEVVAQTDNLPGWDGPAPIVL